MHSPYFEAVRIYTCNIMPLLQLGEHRLFQRSHVQLLRPGAPRLGMQIPVYIGQILWLHNIGLSIINFVLCAFPLPLPPPHASDQLAINRTINDDM